MQRFVSRSRALLVTLPLLAFACEDARVRPPSDDPPSPGFGDGGTSPPRGETCEATVVGAASVPVDLIFLLERSGAMEGKKWDVSARTILEFSRRGFPTPTRAGLLYVPFRPPDMSMLQENYDPTCAEPLYHELTVPLGELPSNARALEDAISDPYVPGMGWLEPTTPLYAALKGAYRIAAKERDAHPDHQVVVVFVGNGEPTTCVLYGADSTNPAVLSGLAASALRYNGVHTFAITLKASASTMTDVVAAGGGSIYFADQDLTQLNDALDAITRSTLDCTFALPTPPPGRQLDEGRVNVGYASEKGSRRTIPAAADYTKCQGGPGWYFDARGGLKRITLCPSSCDDVRRDPLTKVEILLGCTTVVK